MNNSIIAIFTFLCIFNSVSSQWVHIPNGMGSRNIYTMAAQGNNIFAGASMGGVYLSTNNGSNWNQTSLTAPIIHSVFADGNYIFAGTAQTGVYSSTNNGANWIQTPLNNKTIYSFTKKNNILFAGSDSNGVYKSTNNGGNWNSSGLPGVTIYSLTQNGSLIIAGTANFGMYVSTDDGSSWIPAPVFDLAVFDFAADSNVVYAGTSAGVYRSTNFGFTWSQYALEEELVSALAISGDNIFAGTFSGGVYVSNNSGANWIQRNEGLTQMTASSFCIINNYLFTGTQNSVFRRPLGELIGITQLSSIVPQNYSLSQNYPNPFNPVTNIKFQLPKKGFARLTILDMLGREIETLVNEDLRAGTYNARWNAAKYASGVYFYRLESGEYSEVKKMIMIK